MVLFVFHRYSELTHFRDSMPACYKIKDIIYTMNDEFQHFSGMDD